MSVPNQVIEAANGYARQQLAERPSPRSQLSIYEEQQAAIRAEQEAQRVRDSKDWTYRCPTCGHTFQADGVTASCPMGPHEGHPGRWPIYYN